MGFRVNGYVGNIQLQDGNQADGAFRFCRDGSLVVSETHGKFYEQASRGNMYVATSSAPLALLVAAVTGNHPTVWNPLGSGVMCEIVRLQLTKTIDTPDAPSAFQWRLTNPAGADISTGGSPITTFTNIPPVNMLIGSGRISKVRYAQVNTYPAIPAYYMGTGISQDTWTAASTYPPMQITVDYEGMLLVPPGVALSLTATVASGGLYFINIFYIEVPYFGMGA